MSAAMGSALALAAIQAELQLLPCEIIAAQKGFEYLAAIFESAKKRMATGNSDPALAGVLQMKLAEMQRHIEIIAAAQSELATQDTPDTPQAEPPENPASTS